MIFQKHPTGNDMKDFNSFVGLVKLMKKYSSKDIIEDFFYNQLVSKTLFCATGCQGLERNNPEGDLEIKGAMVNYLYDSFPYLKSYKSKVDAAIDEYYKNYKMIEISEGFIPYGSKLSTIFEAVDLVEASRPIVSNAACPKCGFYKGADTSKKVNEVVSEEKKTPKKTKTTKKDSE